MSIDKNMQQAVLNATDAMLHIDPDEPAVAVQAASITFAQLVVMLCPAGMDRAVLARHTADAIASEIIDFPESLAVQGRAYFGLVRR